MCDSVEGSSARWVRSAVLHTLTISTTSSAAAGNLTRRARMPRRCSKGRIMKVLKGSNYDGTAGSSLILNGMPNYLQAEL